MIQTSICIGKAHKVLLIDAASKMDMSVNSLIALILQRSRKLFGEKEELFHTVKYQRFFGENYTVMHMEIPEIEYEYAVAMRYVFKISVSFIVRLGIELLIWKLIAEYERQQRKSRNEGDYVSTNFFTATYFARTYSINHSYSGGFEFWKLNWQT